MLDRLGLLNALQETGCVIASRRVPPRKLADTACTIGLVRFPSRHDLRERFPCLAPVYLNMATEQRQGACPRRACNQEDVRKNSNLKFFSAGHAARQTLNIVLWATTASLRDPV